MACLDRVNMIAYVLVLVVAFSTVDAMDFFSHFDGMFDDPFMLMFQNRSTCGRRHASAIMKDTTTSMDDDAEHEVQAGEYPWQVALYHGDMKLCSAVLIHEQWLLTAASCIPYLKEPYTVVAGALSLLSDDDDGGQHTQLRMTKEIYIHPLYDARRMEFDIALAQVEIHFELNDYVNVICLPHPTMHRDFRPGSKARIAGWGHVPPATERPGACPEPTGDIINACEVEMCETDVDCSTGEKCCHNGCDIMTCTEAMPPSPGPRPGVLRGGITPLINHTTCNQTMMGALPDMVICAGVTPQKHGDGGMEMMEEGGIVAFLKWKKKMKEMARGTGKDFDEDEDGLIRRIDPLARISLLMEHIDDADGSVDDYGRRQSGAWSFDKMGGVMRSEHMDEQDDGGDSVDEMLDAWMKGEMEGEMDYKMIEAMMSMKQEMAMTMITRNCKGDKGSPLVAEFEGQWYVLGVSILPRGCLFGSSPGLYIHLFKLQEWIRPIFNGKEPKRKSMTCTVGEFSCGDGWCIPEEFRCDGKKDCILGTDEGQFCEGAMKGFNVHLGHHLNRSTVARAFPVRSFAQCARACLQEPYLCPGFDVVLMPAPAADSPPIVPKHTTDDHGDDRGDDPVIDEGKKEATYYAEDESGDEISIMLDGMTIMCLLANSTSSVVVASKDDVVPISRLKMTMMPLVESVHLHFKLPRHAPLAALFSPTMNLYLPTGLIVSPSYILGHDLAAHMEDKSFVVRFIKKLLTEELVKVSRMSCLMCHPDWDAIQEMEKMVMMIREEAKNVLVRMEDGGMEDEGMGRVLRRVGAMKMQLKEMAMNFTMVMGGMKRDCDVMSIKRGLMLRMGKMFGNATCEMMGKDGDMMEGELREIGGEEDQEGKTEVMTMLMEMMNELEEVMPDLLMNNMYPEEDGMMMMEKSSTGDKMMMAMGSMMGDSWGMLGNDDAMSTFLTDTIEEMMVMDSEELKQSLNSSMMMMMIKEVMAITSALAMDRCNHGNMTSGHALEGWMHAVNDVMGSENMTEEAFAMMRMIAMEKKVKVGHHKWSIAQSPHQVNRVTFRFLDIRSPRDIMDGSSNMDEDFGMVVLRGFKGVPMATGMIVSHMSRRMAMLDQKLMGEDWDVRGDMDGMSDEMDPPMTEDERSAMDWGWETMYGDTTAMDAVFPGNMDEDVFWKVVEYIAEQAADSGMDKNPDVMHLIEALRHGDIDMETFIHGVGPGIFRRLYARMMMKMKMLDALGRAFRIGDLLRGKSFSVDGSMVEVEQYTTNERQHGILMEYMSGWSCDQKLTKTMGVLTSPNFPKAYPINVRCNSFISAPSGYVVVLYVMRFKLEWSPYCLHDSLTIYDETSPDNWTKLGQGSYCGTMVPLVFRSSGPNLLVKFMSGSDYDPDLGNGFKIIYAFQPVARAMSDQANQSSSSSSSPDITGTETKKKLRVMKDKVKCLMIALGVISGVLLLVVIVVMVWIYREQHAKNKREKSTVFDTKL